jgi:O-antigen/teichoic acid export membrane protein
MNAWSEARHRTQRQVTLLDPQSSDNPLAPAPKAAPALAGPALPDVSGPASAVARLWERFNGGVWTLLDQGAISLGTFLVNVQLARQFDVAEYGTFALLFGGFFLVQHFNASLIYYPLVLKLSGGKQQRSSDLVFVSLILTALSTIASSAVITSCLIIFGRSEITLAAAVYLVLWQFQDVLRRALLAQFSHQMAAIADGIAYIGAAAGIAILADFHSLSVSNALIAMAGTCALAIAVQVFQRLPTFPGTGNARDLLHGFWTHGKWAFVNGAILIVTVQAFPWSLTMLGGPAAAAAFQAVLNVVNVANPIAFGLSNIIMPTVTQAHAAGSMRSAWTAAQTYIIIGATLLSFCVILVMLMPHTVLALFYGANSPYAYMEQAVSVMMLAVAINSIADMISTFIHGVGSAKRAVWMNGISLAVVALLLPLVGLHGVLGCALVLTAAKVVRLIAACRIVARMLSSEERPSSGRVESADGQTGA